MATVEHFSVVAILFYEIMVSMMNHSVSNVSFAGDDFYNVDINMVSELKFSCVKK